VATPQRHKQITSLMKPISCTGQRLIGRRPAAFFRITRYDPVAGDLMNAFLIKRGNCGRVCKPDKKKTKSSGDRDVCCDVNC
jgi:hypothetical protein